MTASLESFGRDIARLKGEVARALVGQEEAVDLMLTALFAGGHALLEGVPGTGKTLLVRALGAVLSLRSDPHPVHPGPHALGHHGHQRLPGAGRASSRP